jgi:hypothetical protein
MGDLKRGVLLADPLLERLKPILLPINLYDLALTRIVRGNSLERLLF